jgi:ACT domain-containing protein
METIMRITEGSLSEIEDGMIYVGDHLGQSELENGSKVLIIQSRSGILRIIPLVDEIVGQVRVSLELNSFTGASRQVYDRIKNSDIRLLHSTGFCPLEESCIWEGYFNVSDKAKLESFVDWLRNMEMVLNVEIVYLRMGE